MRKYVGKAIVIRDKQYLVATVEQGGSGEWMGQCADGAISFADTKEELCDKLGGVFARAK